jgi:adenylate kinase
MGVEAKKFIDAGNLISDDVVIGIVKERLAKSDCKRGFILDGFPRTVSQAIALSDMGIAIDRVVFIDVPDEVIFDRMSGRRVCQKCGATYHVTDHPSKAGDLCEKCGGELMIRSDDAPEVVHSRLEVYHTTTEPLYDHYVAQGNLVKVDGLGSVEETIARTFRALGVE